MKIEPGNQVRAAGILLIYTAHGDTEHGDVARGHSEFLLMRHPDRWDLPKGHCESGESFQDTGLRETEEETGIPAERIRLDPEFSFDLVYPVQYKRFGDTVFQKKVRYFLGYLDDKPALKLTEHPAAQWFPWNPPHRIQDQTIDPLLAAVARHLGEAG